MTISIVIPVYNASLLLKRCLDSVFGQVGNFSIEVICIDDGSTDESVAIIKNYPKPIVLLQQSNQGPASARNKGIKSATGKYLAFLDADDYWKDTFLSETVNFLEKYNNAIAVSVGQKHITIGSSGTIVPEFLETEPKKIKQALVLDNFFKFWAEHAHVCTGSILMRTDIVKQTGGQRIDLRITEDLEFWAYLATFGSIGFIPSILFISDGVQITKQTGWINKNKKRWASAPTVQQWEERIIDKIPQECTDSFYKARGRIAKNLCYSMIMSSRAKQAREIGVKYGHSFPNDKIGNLLQFGSKNNLFWLLVIIIIQLKEYSRGFTIRSLN